MNLAPLPAGVLTALLLSTGAAAQDFTYPNFSSTAGLSLNGSAAQSGTSLRLTAPLAIQVGSAWHTAPVSVAEGFETQFQFAMSPSPAGMAFVVQGSPAGATALGGDMWGLGYGFGSTTNPITNSLAIEFDCARDGFLNDTSANEISVHTTGALGNSENEGVSIGRVTPTQDFSNNAAHTVRIYYEPGFLQVYLDDLLNPLLTVPFTFESGGTQLTGGSTGGLGLGGITAWVGFTAATPFGTTGQFADVRAWDWTSYTQPHPCYTGNVGAGSGGPYDLLTINGDNGGFFRLARLNLADPFTVGVAPPPGLSSAPYLLFATLGPASASTATSTIAGTACFPLLASIDLGPAPAPVTFPVPPGLLLPELTLQAAMATDPLNPAAIGLTNAIGVRFTPAPAPSVAAVTPNSAPLGGTISIAGDNFSQFVTLDIDGVPVPVSTVTQTIITFAMPAGVACDATLRIRNPDGGEGTLPFNRTPTITNAVNTSGPAAGGGVFAVIGTGFAPGMTAMVGAVPATVTSASATAVVLSMPPGPIGPATVVFTTPGGCSVSSTYTYQ
ncbi:MAG: IPT/TIG domain-containing protein [Planctomycetota bacterium]